MSGMNTDSSAVDFSGGRLHMGPCPRLTVLLNASNTHGSFFSSLSFQRHKINLNVKK